MYHKKIKKTSIRETILQKRTFNYPYVLLNTYFFPSDTLFCLIPGTCTTQLYSPISFVPPQSFYYFLPLFPPAPCVWVFLPPTKMHDFVRKCWIITWKKRHFSMIIQIKLCICVNLICIKIKFRKFNKYQQH